MELLMIHLKKISTYDRDNDSWDSRGIIRVKVKVVKLSPGACPQEINCTFRDAI